MERDHLGDEELDGRMIMMIYRKFSEWSIVISRRM